MPSYLITWRPLSETARGWSADNLDHLAALLSQGRPAAEDWRMTRAAGVKKGERVFLIRQGKRGLALIGWGRIGTPTRRIDGKRRAEVIFEAVARPNHNEVFATRAELERITTKKGIWDTQASGIALPTEVAAAVERLVTERPEPQIERTAPSDRRQRWDLEPGATLPRREVNLRFGGNRMSGIADSAQTANVLLFSNPVKGKQFGYDRFEGWCEDGTFAYTGEGQEGDQSLDSPGNRALLTAETNGKAIRLFTVAGSMATYVGEFLLADVPHVERRSLDKHGNERAVFVFNLAPVHINLDERRTPAPEIVQTTDWTPPADTTFEVTPLREPIGPHQISRREMELQGAYGRWLQAIGHSVTIKRIPVAGTTTTMVPDFFDETAVEVVEAKKSTARVYVREAIGQVLDYSHALLRLTQVRARAVILLPALPATDLVDLCNSLGIDVVYQSGEEFKRVSSATVPSGGN